MKTEDQRLHYGSPQMMNPQRQQLEIPWAIPAPDTNLVVHRWCEGDRITLSNAPGTVWEITGIEELAVDLISVSPSVGTYRTAPLWLLRPATVSGADVSGADNIVAPDANSPSGATPKPHHWVETYSPAKRVQTYYRYVWMEGRRLRHLHISGGNTKSAIALTRKCQIESAIASGQTPDQIQSLIKSWRSTPPT